MTAATDAVEHRAAREAPGGGAKIDRWAVWLAIAGGLGIVIAIVALIIAISANHSANNNKQTTRQLQAQAISAVAAVDSRLRGDASAASTVLRKVTSASRRANRADARLRRDLNANALAVKTNAAGIKITAAGVKSNAAGVKANRTRIQRLENSVQNVTTSIKGLTSAVQKIDNRLALLRAGQNALDKRITLLGG